MKHISKPVKIAVLLSFSGAGGVERMVMNLVNAFAAEPDITVDLLLIRATGPHFVAVPDNVNVIHCKANHTLLAIPEIMRYLRQVQPKALLVAKDRAGRAALLARRLSQTWCKDAGVKTKIIIRLGTNLSAALQHRSLLNRYWRVWPMRLIYGWVDAVVAVSQGVKTDTLNITGLAEEKISVIRNPVLTDALQQINKTVLETVPHPWLEKKRSLPVIMAAGRLSQQKDFTTLISAFQQVQLKQSCRLIILGEGRLRGELEQQIAELGLAEQVLLPGFQANIHHWLKPADLFVLSSRWEGSPNVLTEALALGVPVVSTACPSGPDELLQQQGQNYGVLVPVGDACALADAIIETLKHPPTKQFLRQAVHAYTVQQSSAAYLQLLLETD